MTSTTVPTRPDAPPTHDPELLADVVARLLTSVDRFRADPPGLRVGWLSLLVADAALLAEAMGPSWGRADLEAITDRLWMVAS